MKNNYDDAQIAKTAATALALSRYEQLRHIRTVVVDGVVTLEGVVSWDFYRHIAESAVRYKPGVKAVDNRIRSSAL